MSARRARWLVFAALLVAMPVPLVVVGRGHLPVGALAELALATLGIGVVERGDGVVGILGALLVAQAIVWALAFWVATGLAMRALGRAALVLVVLGVATALVLPVYRSPFHATRIRQTLAEVYR